MFHGAYDRTARADRYRKVAAEYTGLSEAATDPSLISSYYLRIAEDYLVQSQGELRALERERIAALASGHMPSSQPQPNAPPIIKWHQRAPREARRAFVQLHAKPS
jgi:hypothetical protein